MSYATPYSPQEEIANTLTHAIGALLSVVGLIVLLLSVPENLDNSTRIASFSIYGASLILLFSASTIYHYAVAIKLKQLFKLIDHCAIYLLIAGTYTPLMLLTLKGPLGYSMLALVWAIALSGIVLKVKYGHKHKKLSLLSYLGMGFISLPLMSELSTHLPSEAIQLLAIGGAIYTLGVIFYINKRIPYNHAIWHLFVLAGAACHFTMVWLYL
ncbi:PAQR family membrane homeostasis protein TrhA [Thalassotalea sp. PLHSN55]|uniref:PAQR family membrane homeostasis protein TrhA n=1 Tax=Thalassotalea sp. PLHSN55 TaxID=3435888 RepID=UPI003F838A04